MTDQPEDTNPPAATEAAENKSVDDTNASAATEPVGNKSGPTEEIPTAVALEAVAEPSSSANPPSNATATVFAWVAFILINSAFIALILWGSFTTWWIGLVVDVVYTIVLLVTGMMLQRRDGWKNSVLASLVFLVAIFSIVVAGLYLPLNVFPCSFNNNNWYDDDYYSRDREYYTNLVDLPTEVREWWNRDDSDTTTFFHFESTGVTLFEGIQEGDRWEESGLWRTTQEGTEPELVPDLLAPEFFVQAGNSTGCFAVEADGQPECRGCLKVVCTVDGFDFVETEQAFQQPVQGLFYANERLWFRTSPPYDPRSYSWGDALYSIDPTNITDVVLHSALRNQEQASNSRNNMNTDDEDVDDDGCTYERTNRVRYLSWLFLSALPALIATIAIDLVHKFSVPTMPIGAYLSFTWLVVCAGFAIDPGNFEDHIYDFFRWWFVFTTGPWLVYLTLQHLTNRSTPSRRSWSTNFASLVYAGSMFLLLRMFDYIDVDYFWQWAVLTLAVVPPLFMVSIITGKIFVLVVVSAVIMVDVYRLTDYITYDVLDSNNVLPIQFVVLGLSGLLLGYLGYLLSRKQASIETRVSKWANAKLGKWVVTEGNEETAIVAVANEEEQDV